jgi:hypothetical protein
MPRTSLPWLILACILVSAALAWWTLTGGGEGSAPASRLEHRDVAPFHELEVGGSAVVTLAQSASEAIDIDAAAHGVRVDAHVADGRLVIRGQDRSRWWSGLFGRRAARAPHVTVRFRTLDAIALTGNVTLDAPKLTTTALRVLASGGSTLSIDDLRATSLHVQGSGALRARLAGRVDHEEVSISGAGSYVADRLLARDATVTVSGVGNVLLHAADTLHASISGAGVIEYVGNPSVTEHVSGIGRVRRHAPEPAAGSTTAAADHRNGAPPADRCNEVAADHGNGAPPADRCNEAASDQCSDECDAPPWSLKNSGPRVVGSTSSWTPGMKRTSDTRQSRSSDASIAPTSSTVSYG